MHCVREFERGGRRFELFVLDECPTWMLFEELGDESALLGEIAELPGGYSNTCFWMPRPLTPSLASTLGDAVDALLATTAGGDVRGGS